MRSEVATYIMIHVGRVAGDHVEYSQGLAIALRVTSYIENRVSPLATCVPTAIRSFG